MSNNDDLAAGQADTASSLGVGMPIPGPVPAAPDDYNDCGKPRPAASDTAQREAQARQARGEGEPPDAILAHPESNAAPGALPLRESPEQFGQRVDWYRGKPESALPLSEEEIKFFRDDYGHTKKYRLLCDQALRAIELEKECDSWLATWKGADAEREELKRENAELKARMK